MLRPPVVQRPRSRAANLAPGFHAEKQETAIANQENEMSDDIYLCHHCLEPIWFPHGQKMHLGTGWYCWTEQQVEEHEEGLVEKAAKFVFTTSREHLRKLLQKAQALYKKWRANNQDRRVVKFICRQLDVGKSDVVHQFFVFLLGEAEEHRRRLVDLIVADPAWDRFVRGKRKPARVKRKTRTRQTK
jgi:hypothetical protein